MISFKNFIILENSDINKIKLKDTVKRFNEISGINSTGYYLKSGSPVFAMAFFHLINKKGEFFSLSDSETEMLHVVVLLDGFYWDINGGSDLKRKEEFITIVGQPKWEKQSEDYILKFIKKEDKDKILEIYKIMKDMYNQNKKD